MGMIKFLVCVEKPMRHAYMLAILIFLLPYNIISQNNIIDFYEIGWRDNYILKKAENKKDSNDLKEAIINYETVLNHYSLNIRANFGIAESYNLLKNKEDIAVIYYMKTYEYASKAILECDKRKNRSNKAEKLQATFREYRDSSRNKIEHIKDKQKYLDQENKTSIKVIEAEKDIINNELVTSVLIAAEEYSGSTKNIIKNKKASEVYYNKFNFVNSEIVSGQNNGELFEPQKQGYESNVINNNMLNTDFIKINAFNPIDQLDEIRKEVCKNIDSLPLLNYSEIEQTNQKWSENNSLKNYSWFNDLTNAQDKYLNVIKIINDTYIVINKMNNDINETVQDIEILKTKIQLSKNELSTLSTSTINDINTEYKSRLATIPQSVVLVARIDLKKYDKNERTIVEKYFDRKINRRAINIIKGTNIVTRILSENGEIFEEYFKTIIGRAQTVDTYYQDKIVYTPKNDWEYKILRMEVFPFEEVNIVNTDKVLDNYTYDSKNIQIYEVELDSVENVLLFDENKKLTKANGLGERVNTYIVKKMLYSSDINTLYSDRYNEARRKYEQKIQEIEPIKKILNFEIDSLKKELDTNQLILEKTQRDLVNIRDVNLFDMYENYEKIKNEPPPKTILHCD